MQICLTFQPESTHSLREKGRWLKLVWRVWLSVYI